MAPQYQQPPPDDAARPPGGYRPAGDPDADRRSAVRIFAVLGVLVWWVVMFGLIDLTTPLWGPAFFFDAYLLEVGWGLLYTVLLGVATLALLWRPDSSDLAAQHLAVAAALTVAAVATPAPGHLIPAAGAAGLGLAVWVPMRRRAPGRYLHAPRGTWWLPAAVVAVAVVPALAYAWSSVGSARAGVTSDTTNGLDHWPAQAAFALALVAVAGQAVLARGGRVPAWCAAVSAAWFGASSVVYPSHVASVGTLGGAVVCGWAVVYLTTWELARRRGPRPPGHHPGKAGAAGTG